MRGLATLAPHQIRHQSLGLPRQLGNLDRSWISLEARPRLSSDDGEQRAQLPQLFGID